MYSDIPKLVLGYHGCNFNTFYNIIFKGETLHESTNNYDWLGHGIYFWENSYSRALQWADSERDRGRYKESAVIGAVINLRNCLDLTDSKNYEILHKGYDTLKKQYELNNIPMPENKKQNESDDTVIRRNLDCEVIETVHGYNVNNDITSFDSVRGVFLEGKPVYKGTKLLDKTHIQIAVRNKACIVGYFIPNEFREQFNSIDFRVYE